MLKTTPKSQLALIAAIFFVSLWQPQIATGVQTAPTTNPIITAIFKKLEEDPTHSDSWRMLGKVFAKEHQFDKAIDALQTAVKLMPESAAAHYDLGKLLGQLDRVAEADRHYQRVHDLDPQSEYANRILATGFVPKPATTMASNQSVIQPIPTSFVGVDEFATIAPRETLKIVEQASYEIQTFDGSDDLETRLRQLESTGDSKRQIQPREPIEEQAIEKRWSFYGETGALYNTNVALTPISRQLASSSLTSVQWIANTELEWSTWKNERWRAGPIGRGNFTTNESQASQLNLSSFQLGSFLERDISIGEQPWISRLEYQYSINQFGGENFGDRHSLTGSLTKINSTRNITYLYAIVANTEFRDDGATPAVTSLDGNSCTFGISRFFLTSTPRLPTWSLGLDCDFADTEGLDNQYFALRAHTQATLTLASKLSLISSGGLGFRTFPEYTGTAERDELTWKLGTKLQYQFRKRANVSFLINYDRFASDNEDFDLDRMTAGIVTTFRY